MKKISLHGFFYALACGVLLLHNTLSFAQKKEGNSPVAEDKKSGADVANFPSRTQAQKNWDKQEPKSASATDSGPNTDIEPAGANMKSNTSSAAAGKGKGKISGKTLPDGQPDYATMALDNVLPMDAAQMKKFAEETYKRSLEMTAIPGGPYTRKPMRRLKISTAPGAPTEVIDVALGMGASVALIDQTGSPVTIASVEGFSDAFKVRVMKTENENIFSIEALKLTGQGGVTIQVKGQPPLLIDVNVGKSTVVDGVVQALVPGMVNTKTVRPGDRFGEDSQGSSPEMDGFLAGIPPDDAVEIPVSRAPETRAWMWNKKLYLVTPHTIINPGYFKRQGSADGTAVYKMPLTPIVNMGVYGKDVQAILDFPYIPTGIVSAGNNTAKTK